MSAASGRIALEGYASVFAAPDQIGDVVRKGAFAASLRRRLPLAMLVRHDPALAAGLWQEAEEDSCGLYVRGAVLPDLPGSALARRMLARGVDGLSIGFRVVRSRPRPGGGRDLMEIDLLEVSLVETPMLGLARLSHAGAMRAPAL